MLSVPDSTCDICSNCNGEQSKCEASSGCIYDASSEACFLPPKNGLLIIYFIQNKLFPVWIWNTITSIFFRNHNIRKLSRQLPKQFQQKLHNQHNGYNRNYIFRFWIGSMKILSKKKTFNFIIFRKILSVHGIGWRS